MLVLGAVLVALRPGSADAQGFAPAEAVQKMTAAQGLSVRLAASEPLVRQPVCIEFDEKGRLWVIQYLQYPNPAGLKRVKVDRFSRTVYDVTPEPPPRGPRGADRITILEDDDGDGRADRAHDFVSGLNLATGLAFGHGGVFVLQVPYLLFYPDRNRDDVPDGDPEVLLKGFGMEDAHSVANSLTWGPDGWLYGLQGSTVTANIRGISFQQGVWRYHPPTKRFELFCEGGGNMWGLDFDRRGRLFASTNVGAHVALHAVQGAFCWKSFGKHGPLHNPYAYGYFDHVAHAGSSREGHVATGGLFYEATSWPERYRGRYVAGDLLGHAVRWYDVSDRGSTAATRLAGDLLVPNDTWFAPCDLTLGPDGAVYVADWHDRRTAHPDPDADWDRTNGRVYAIEPRGATRSRTEDLRTLSSEALLKMLESPSNYHARWARRILAERKDPTSILALRERVVASPATSGLRPVDALWTLASAGEFDADLAGRLIDHPDALVRLWTARLIGDDPSRFPAPLIQRLVSRGAVEKDLSVRAQLASTARRLPPKDGLTLAAGLLARDLPEDRRDAHIPLLLWWAVEPLAAKDPAVALEQIERPEVRKSKLFTEFVWPRLVRRFVAEGTGQGDEVARKVLDLHGSDLSRVGLEAIDQGLDERPRGSAAPSPAFLQSASRAWSASPDDPLLTRLAARLGHESARSRALSVALDRSRPEALRASMIGVLSSVGPGAAFPQLRSIALENPPGSAALAALDALGRDDDGATADLLVGVFPGKPETWRSHALSLLTARSAWAGRFLHAVEAGRIDPKSIPVEPLRAIASLGDPALDSLVRKHWGKLGPPTPEEKLAEVRRLNNDLRAGPGNAERGRKVFLENCSTCHQLFGEGKAVGPDLTHANRGDRDYLLVSLVDPSAVVRNEYQSAVVATRDGRVATGLLGPSDPARLVLFDSKGDRNEIPRADVESVREIPESLMPGDLYRRLRPDDLRDLFRYLQGGPVAK
ncbi:MAG: PVC-type heme-binding CxxCH protein [Isosphaeraceae bacterium]